MQNSIVIRGAREHNLKNIDLEIPRNKLVVFTGLSGSGKSSLAFDTLYAEGQRRYVESLSSYARQFLGLMEKPDVDYIEGLSPAISIDQKTTSRNPRSTVGTVTEVYDYLRLLYARIGVPHCPQCGKEIRQQTVDQMVDRLLQLEEGSRVFLLSPVIRGRKGEHAQLFQDLIRQGYTRVRVDGEMYELDEKIPMAKTQRHNVEVVIDRIIIRKNEESSKNEIRRLTDSFETAIKLSEGIAVALVQGQEEITFSANYACTDCGISIEEITPRMFSFNSPYGACPKCGGLGKLLKIDPDLVVDDWTKSLREGALSAMTAAGKDDTLTGSIFQALADRYGFSMDTPLNQLTDLQKEKLFYGTGEEKLDIVYERAYSTGRYQTSFEGVIPTLERRYQQTQSQSMKEYYEALMSEMQCPDCGGKRLRREARAVTLGGLPLCDYTELSVDEELDFLNHLLLTDTQQRIADQILKEIRVRLGFLRDVGLGYLTLHRAAATLSGGEAQRIRLATQIGSALTGVLYILDEPSIGLHQRDNARLLSSLKGLRDLGNSVIVVEHDEETMMAADYLVDIGPGPGIHGGYIVAKGTPQDVMDNDASITGAFLSGRRSIAIPPRRRAPGQEWLTIRGAKQNNLKGIDVKFPLGLFTVVTGVSGSGKSSLVNEIIYKTLARELNRAKTKPGICDGIEGLNYLDKVICIDQTPIGRTPRSNPATYTGAFDLIRDLFAETTDARSRGYKAGRFSFNMKGGRCEACGGDGILRIEMNFLPDVFVPCDVCKGKRYNRETLEVHYKGKSIADILDMTVEEAVSFFKPIPRIMSKIRTLYDVGLGYIKLGQPSTQLSGGEAQRIKLATELSKKSTGKTVYILDEPTTGLHNADVERLIDILQRLTDQGNTIIVIEHNLDVIKTADWIVDMGPEGGEAGGSILISGTPEEVADCTFSYTGQFLKEVLQKRKSTT